MRNGNGNNDKWRKNVTDPSIENIPGILERQKAKPGHPAMYEVLLLNDDFTPIDFVITLAQRFFNKSTQEATVLTMQVHNFGQAVYGIYTREVAETKVIQVTDYARQHNFPLKCVMQKSKTHAI